MIVTGLVADDVGLRPRSVEAHPDGNWLMGSLLADP
jgi:hypothetical protein